MLEITTTAASVIAQHRAAVARFPQTLLPTMRRVGLLLQGVVRQEKLQGQVLDPRTRQLTRAIYQQTTVDRQEQVVITRVGADLAMAPHGRIHEEGGVIRPKRGKHLAIPVGRALTKESSVSKGVSARTFMDNPASLGYKSAFVSKGVILGVRNTSVATSTFDATTGGQRAGRRRMAVTEVVFVLKSFVTIPRRSYLASTLRERKDQVRGLIRVGTGEFVRDLSGGSR